MSPTRRRLRAVAFLGAVVVSACRASAPPHRDVSEAPPRDAWRFPVLGVTDSTITFPIADAPWVRTGQAAVAVDPARADALVAHLTVTMTYGGRATALVSGQVSRLSPSHAVLLRRPPARAWRTRAFWTGVATGAAVGVAGGVLAGAR